MPFLSEAQYKNYIGTKETLSEIIELLHSCEAVIKTPNYALTMYLYLYNNFKGDNGLKADAFLAMVYFCERLGRLDILVG